MSSTLQFTLELLLRNNYLSLAVVTAAVYDYFLTFASEMEYIWCRPWTWVSTMFFLIRYVGLCWAICSALGGSSFVPATLETYVPEFEDTTWSLSVRQMKHPTGTVVYLISAWTFLVLFAAADLMMILRVHAMWSRSKPVLWSLLAVYVTQVLTTVCLNGIYSNSNIRSSMLILRVSDLKICSVSLNEVPIWFCLYNDIPRFVLSVLLLVLGIFQTLKQSLKMYLMTKRWQSNRYMQLLARDGIIYFLINTVLTVTSIIQNSRNNVIMHCQLLVCYITMPSVMPRFIISVRALYERDLRVRWQGVDTGFGVFSRSQDTFVSVIAFADGDLRVNRDDQDQVAEGDLGDSDEIHTELSESEYGTCRV